MILVAITGTVCSGKSFLGKIIKRLGYPMFSCDDEIHKILKKKEIMKKISAEFHSALPHPSSRRRPGPSTTNDPPKGSSFIKYHPLGGVSVVLGPGLRRDDGVWEINKKLLAEIIFRDPKARQKLEDILYPELFTRQDKFIAKLKKANCEIAFFEVPLLYEKNLESQYEHVIVTCAPPSVLVDRAVERKIDQKVFSNILENQMPSFEKEARADFVLNTNILAKELEKRIKETIKEILKCQEGK